MTHPHAGNERLRPWRLLLAAWLGCALGCGTTRVTDTQRTATEQLLVTHAVDRAVSQLDFRVLEGKPVYFDAQYLAGAVDRGYVVSSLRQHLLASGCLLVEDRSQANYVVEARAGTVGTDLHQLLFGVPQINLPVVVPGQPSLIPEIPLAKRTDQKGVAKLAVFAYNRVTGRPVWQSGVVQTASTSKDTWVLGAGPFRRGTLGEPTEIIGQQVSIPLLSGKEGGNDGPAPVVAVTQPAVWEEGAAPPLPPPRPEGRLTGTERPAEDKPPPSVESVGVKGAEPKSGAKPDPGAAKNPPVKDAGGAKTTSPPASGERPK